MYVSANHMVCYPELSVMVVTFVKYVIHGEACGDLDDFIFVDDFYFFYEEWDYICGMRLVNHKTLQTLAHLNPPPTPNNKVRENSTVMFSITLSSLVWC
jgi:hypothetical protein